MKSLFGSLAFLFLCYTATAVCDSNSTHQARKYYCEPAQIEITNTTILIHIKDSQIEVDSLFVDQGGVYFTDEMMRCLYCRRPINPKNTCEHSSCLARH